MKNKGGRPRKLTSAIKDAIIDGIKKGLTLKAACKCAGISYSSLANWKKFVNAEDDETDLYAELVVSVNLAMRQAWFQHREKALSSIKNDDFKFKLKPRKLNRKEREEKWSNDAIAKLRERLEKLKSDLQV